MPRKCAGGSEPPTHTIHFVSNETRGENPRRHSSLVSASQDEEYDADHHNDHRYRDHRAVIFPQVSGGCDAIARPLARGLAASEC